MKIQFFCFFIFIALVSPYDLSQITNQVLRLGKTWQSGHNQYFKNLSLEQIKSMMGTLKIDPKQRLPEITIKAVKDIPEEFDSRVLWDKCESIKQVRDQSTCGSCWAFAAVESMSDRICIASGQRQQIRLSTRDLLSCCGQLTCGFGCNGGNPHGAWKYFKNTGIVQQKCQPYPFPPCDHHVDGKYGPCGGIKPTPSCQKKCNTTEIVYKEDLHQGKLIYSVPSKVSQIQTEIMTNGPVQASFEVYEDFLTYKKGVYIHVTGKGLGGHSVKIIGWGVESSTPYWLVANSWNSGWGDNGFFKIKRGSNECGIEKEVVAGIPIISNYLQSQ